MKLTTCTFLVLLSVAAGAAESDQSPPGKSAAASGWKLDYDLKLDKKVGNIAGGMTVTAATKCYFIRMVRPLPEASSSVDPPPRFIPLQSRALGMANESVCAPGGQILRAVR